MNLLLDLDGTLTDPAPGITRSLQHALAALGRQVPAASTLTRFIGPPLRQSFGELLATDDDALIAAAVASYRVRFSDVGLFENSVYSGIPETLAALRAAGHRAWIVTAKPRVYARRIADHFGLSVWVDDVFGSELSGENTDKRDLIRVVLGALDLSPAGAFNVGDRGSDIVAARANGIGALGVTWGYGTLNELATAGPDGLLHAPPDLLAFAGDGTS